MSRDELVEVAKRELRSIDRRFLFWVQLASETKHDSGASAADVDWQVFDWDALRVALDEWLDGLPPDTDEVAFRWPVNENLRLCFIAKPRTAESAAGYRRYPSLNVAEPDPMPPLTFADDVSARLDALPVETVADLAAGRRRLAIALVSHQAAWQTLYEVMVATGRSNTAEMHPYEIEAVAGMLALVEEPSSPLGSFDEGYRAIEGIDTPLTDDPRDEAAS